MVDINWTVFPQIINFLVLIIVLNIVLYKPIRKILLERKTKVEGLSKGIESANRQAEEKDQAFSLGIREARAKGQKEKEAMMQAAGNEEKEIIGRIMDQARADLAAVKSQVAKLRQHWRRMWTPLPMPLRRKYWGGRLNEYSWTLREA
jgi:F-type H+-transporting ATPase subunit b